MLATVSDSDTGVAPRVRSSICKYDVYRHQPDGWLVKQPVIRFVFWGSYWEEAYNEALTTVQTWDDLVTNERILPTLLSEYGIRDGVVAVKVWNTEATIMDGTVKDADVPRMLNASMLRGELPIPNSDAIFVIVLPPNVSTPMLNENGSGTGYHSSATYGGDKYTYAVIDHTLNFDNRDITIAHEIYETVTDPDDGGYRDNKYFEVGDICNGIPRTMGSHTVQKVFSQKACQCL